jgi:hypothetical protein
VKSVIALCIVLWAALANCDDRYGYPTYRPRPINRSVFVTVLGNPRIYYVPDTRPYDDPYLYAPVRVFEAPPEPMRWHPAPCRMQGPFAVDWRETCRSRRTK